MFWDTHFVHHLIATRGHHKQWSEVFNLAAVGPKALAFFVAGGAARAAEQSSDEQLLQQVGAATQHHARQAEEHVLPRRYSDWSGLRVLSRPSAGLLLLRPAPACVAQWLKCCLPALAA